MTPEQALAAARAMIAAHAEAERHHVAATVLTDRAAYTALNLECTLPRGSVCAEQIAVGMAAAAEPGRPVRFSVAVNRRGEVIPPCGLCRELMLDYGAGTRIAVAEEEGGRLRIRTLAELLPDAYKAHRGRGR